MGAKSTTMNTTPGCEINGGTINVARQTADELTMKPQDRSRSVFFSCKMA